MAELRTPYFLVDEERLVHNLEILKDVAERSGARILLAQKAFSMFACYPPVSYTHLDVYKRQGGHYPGTDSPGLDLLRLCAH